MATQEPNVNGYVLNCKPSLDSNNEDWSYEDAVNSKTITDTSPSPSSKDLRDNWWTIPDQKKTGACVGFATADGVLRWHFTQAKKISKKQSLSVRFIWMANKETDDFTKYPTTFLESAGTSTKLALRVAQRYGCVLEHMLRMDGKLSPLRPKIFFSIAAQLRISRYYNLGVNLDKWRLWIDKQGPVLTRLDVDRTWKNATQTKGRLSKYNKAKLYGGHAVCLVGYTPDYFIVRNSWGEKWGDKGFAYASNEYASEAFSEAYGAVI